jgi:Avidin family
MFAGKWVNERGSTMILEQHGDRISGRYVTRVGDDEVAGSEHPIVGLATGAAIGFVVAWPAAGSVASWAGRLDTDAAGNAALHTVWHVVRTVSGDPPRALDAWESFLTNSSVFRRYTGES